MCEPSKIAFMWFSMGYYEGFWDGRKGEGHSYDMRKKWKELAEEENDGCEEMDKDYNERP